MRYALATAVCLLSANGAMAADMEKECAVQGALAQSVADERSKGTSQRKALRLVSGGLTEDAAKYADFVPTLVAYIYEQVPANLIDENVGEVWRTQCLAAVQK
ncbi:hypothetical protein [Pseudoprimorskyibacter insulae]|uniref:DNA primase n=1 Tax=Pseudoprimorskyibacter insulae TaxID=1695997 RepID=A0A2R8AQE2_9RHOB|nr:hypothetical protein [Pseudoprimorskyibacter insulae]SPF78272.1 hypothetical protein PRI8871_00867 [Pseudoprimorskyibacter insulae]